MPIYRINRSFILLAASLAMLSLGSGCMGPMACGPMGCGGPIVAGHGNCGSGCGDSCNGCGERYYDEWINHPPSCTDPCDSCGYYQGQSCHACRPILSGFKSIWGYRCDPPPVGCASAGCDNLGCRGGCEPICDIHQGCDSGCRTCGGGHHGGGTLSPLPIETSYELHPPSIVRESANVKPFQPQRSRQIFQARDPNTARGTGTPQF